MEHKVTSTLHHSDLVDQEQKFHTSYEPLVKPAKRKISVHSWRDGDEAIKMKFTEVKGQIFLNIAFKPKKQKVQILKSPPHLLKIMNKILNLTF